MVIGCVLGVSCWNCVCSDEVAVGWWGRVWSTFEKDSEYALQIDFPRMFMMYVGRECDGKEREGRESQDDGDTPRVGGGDEPNNRNVKN